MKVFGIGLARTGTSSLNKALKMLGRTSKHFPRSYQTVLEYDCVTDTSVTLGYKYLDFMFPDAKFVLTTRDVDSWLDSMSSLLEHLASQEIADRYHRLHYALYGTVDFDERKLRDAYRRHHEDVADHFRGRDGSLLTLDLTAGAGFPQLCSFLDEETPDAPFPHSNDRTAMLGSRPGFTT
ncbi:sulfotransferase family protein [Streptomyces sp. NPDC021218]|uniref:sulfotransferase family protein n=1 Tax=Streptomyces TaxID=1883 RepID=UPI00362D62AF